MFKWFELYSLWVPLLRLKSALSVLDVVNRSFDNISFVYFLFTFVCFVLYGAISWGFD